MKPVIIITIAIVVAVSASVIGAVLISDFDVIKTDCDIHKDQVFEMGKRFDAIRELQKETPLGTDDYLTIGTTGEVGINTCAENRFHVYDSNNTTEAPVLIQQDGTGDSAINFLADGTDWTLGLDNSENNSFKISKYQRSQGIFLW